MRSAALAAVLLFALPALADDVARGNITSSESVTISTIGQSTVGISIAGTWTGTLVFESSINGSTFASANASSIVSAASGAYITSTTANMTGQANVGGFLSFRIRGNTVTSGTAIVTIRATPGIGPPVVTAITNAQSTNNEGAAIQRVVIAGSESAHPARAITGHRTTTTTGSVEDLWDGPTIVRPQPSAGIQMEIVSSSANDAAAGTGARTVAIQWLNSSGVVSTETVTLNGVTPVNTVATTIYRINKFIVRSAGTGLRAAGNIDIRSVGGATVYDRIGAGYTTAWTCAFTVPAGQRYWLQEYQYGTGGNKPAELIFYTNLDPLYGNVTANGFFIASSVVWTQAAAAYVHSSFPGALPAMTDVKLSVLSGAIGAEISVSINGYLTTP